MLKKIILINKDIDENNNINFIIAIFIYLYSLILFLWLILLIDYFRIIRFYNLAKWFGLYISIIIFTYNYVFNIPIMLMIIKVISNFK